MKWFKHDSDAGNDSKLKKLKNKFGLAGYGLYFHTLELMSRKIESDIEHVGFLPEEWDIESLEIEFGQTPDSIGTMYDYMVQIKLFTRIDGKLYNDKLKGRCDEYTARLLKKAGFIENTGTNSRQAPDSIGTKTDNVYPRIDKIRKDKKKIEKNRIDKDKNINNVATEVAEKNPGNEINSLLAKFKPLNPTYQRLFANKTQRSAVERMVKVLGYDWLNDLLEKLPEILKLPYAPRISTPLELENKMGNLKQFMEQRKEEYGKSRIPYVGEPIA